jgi:hypothetical protein
MSFIVFEILIVFVISHCLKLNGRYSSKNFCTKIIYVFFIDRNEIAVYKEIKAIIKERKRLQQEDPEEFERGKAKWQLENNEK